LAFKVSGYLRFFGRTDDFRLIGVSECRRLVDGVSEDRLLVVGFNEDRRLDLGVDLAIKNSDSTVLRAVGVRGVLLARAALEDFVTVIFDFVTKSAKGTCSSGSENETLFIADFSLIEYNQVASGDCSPCKF